MLNSLTLRIQDDHFHISKCTQISPVPIAPKRSLGNEEEELLIP